MPSISAALPGVAIATALMPPLCTVGVGLAMGRWDVAGGALLLFITNAVTIAFAAMLVFSAVGFSVKREDGRIEERKRPQELGAYDYTMQAMPHVWILEKEEATRALELLDKALALADALEDEEIARKLAQRE